MLPYLTNLSLGGFCSRRLTMMTPKEQLQEMSRRLAKCFDQRSSDFRFNGTRVKGYIYIASSFHTVNRSACGQGGAWIDNDPHFWTSPPTWGICRPDLRASADDEDVVFFVLPKNARHPQMIFAYLTIERIVTHLEAFGRPELLSKRMGNKNPNGNIIVNANGSYNRFDAGEHFHNFQKIKQRYAIGRQTESRMLSHREIQRFAPSFVERLSLIIGKSGVNAIDIISRKGRKLTSSQVEALLAWLSESRREP